ncbi:bifunctional diaminohydroxyphosphoribosylaminopyrimidine deaminase/5-amino-6-(5-phosphoribosylamino)uracil reductase RibD [Geomicrobium sp. JCM 19038]|uniref:bifunctional diaminohydroxyphosphoribosylaminopyrimidine deaminase/5-amino-6-(5-phosphoribosylamino)uracil reductase RibD n=1 Tax=Geomicrobium sp. JCM 19038 TaxID=1460635 RepID=UPI00045F3F48|nr:bifunctional diaminohydroxyphosphoribosylaminopyrimidine deaminase/5-amino-6-(5-phosphoribosylamino)uracil reductase RibD [Geomicrobium sp. JCM 19038]GAK08205.1 diaminohydroxyphosphoribosylaminopyrimidine deaminase [Geomicrobium sp. JCM 19038]
MSNQNEYMNLALEQAKMVSGQTSPNPTVGAVIVNEGEIVGVGAHLRAGEAHAEVHALQMAGERARGSTLYVTLEPCQHRGRTGPCTTAIIQANVSQVVIAMLDPNPVMQGKSVRVLERSGITVDVGVLEEEARRMNRTYIHWMKTKKPYVTLKMAGSLDGKTATSQGESQWITSSASRSDGHVERKNHDAILVGVETVIQDNPALTSRDPYVQPIRVVLDRNLRIPRNSKLLTDTYPTIIYTEQPSVFETTKQIVTLSKVTPESVLQDLGNRNITSLLVEGGATIHGAFFTDRVVQRTITYLAPKLIGGAGAHGFIAGSGALQLNDALQVTYERIEHFDGDIKITAIVGEEDVYRHC